MATPSSGDPSHYLPRAIAHRGYKAEHVENTMGAFEAAVKIGAHAIETDLHLSSDGVAVLSHVRRRTSCYLPPLTGKARTPH